MADQNVNISKSDIEYIISEKKLAPNLEKSNCKVTYRVLLDIFCIINDTEKPLRPKDNLGPCLNLICKNDVTDIVGKPSNFM